MSPHGSDNWATHWSPSCDRERPYPQGPREPESGDYKSLKPVVPWHPSRRRGPDRQTAPHLVEGRGGARRALASTAAAPFAPPGLSGRAGAGRSAAAASAAHTRGEAVAGEPFVQGRRGGPRAQSAPQRRGVGAKTQRTWGGSRGRRRPVRRTQRPWAFKILGREWAFGSQTPRGDTAPAEGEILR